LSISNDDELREASEQAGALIQQIHYYCVATGRTIQSVPEARIRFPRNYLRTAGYQRSRFPFLENDALKSNIAYTLMLSDTILWVAVRTDINNVPYDMLRKLFIFLIGAILECTTKEYLKETCGQGFEKRSKYLVDEGIISQKLKEDIDWIWEVRNRMHLYGMDYREWENEYDLENHMKTINAFRAFLKSLEKRGKLK
jgi:hypothetical protein